MGNSLEQYRASIGLNNSGPRSRRKQPDVFSAALTDLLKMVVVLQVLLAGLLVLQLHLFDQPWQPSLGYEEGGASVFFPLVGKVITDLKWVAIQKQQKFHKTLSSVLQVLEKLWEEEENGFFSVVRKSLLVREGVEANPGPPTIGETLDWYRETLQNGKLSEAKIKSESLSFFNLSSANQMKDKKRFKIALEGLVTAHTKTQKNILREVLKNNNGQGAFYDLPPADYSTQICDDKKRKAFFVKQCREEMKIGSKYLSWIDNDFDLFIASKKVTTSQIKDNLEDGLKLTRERSSGPNIHDASKITYTKQSDGTLLKKVTKQTYANITVREKRKIEGPNAKEISEEGFRKRAKMVSNILDHTSKHDQDTKAKLVAKIIDKEGKEFGKKIKQKSKMIQATTQLSPAQTNSLMTWTRTSKYSWRQSRTLFHNALGFSPIASQKKVDVEAENIMTVKKEDWSFEKKLMYTNKQGKNKGVPKETTVLLVKDLLPYMIKLAESEKLDLDLSGGELPVCIDADAGEPPSFSLSLSPS